MEMIEFAAPCHFGTEAVLKREIYDIGYEVSRVEDGRVFFTGDAEAAARANLCLRTAERVLIHMGSFEARSFEELFEGIRALPWEDFIPKDGCFPVAKASTVKSRLFSVPDIQSVTKKAVVKRLGKVYRINWFKEEGARFPIRLFLYKDRVSAFLDTTGTPLHKRGYRTLAGGAPISETLAAALLALTPWRAERTLFDPFCGSGTFLIEAAMTAANIAPGLKRSFLCEEWEGLLPSSEWKELRAELKEEIDRSVITDLSGIDIDADVLKVAKENAKRAGVGSLIRFEQQDVRKASREGSYGFILTNPPYGERMENEETLPGLYRALGDLYRRLDRWSMYVITSYGDAEKHMGRAKKNRKIYNGMIRSYFYQYPGPKPDFKSNGKTDR